jgi:hypothetical protein
MDNAGPSVNSDVVVVNGCTLDKEGKETSLATCGKLLSVHYLGSCLSRISYAMVADGPLQYRARSPIGARSALTASSSDSPKELLTFPSGEWFPLSGD